jgi:hypothetical protein
MAACYAAHATFEDAVFRLEGDHIGTMWAMLCERAKDLRIEVRNVVADDSTGSADWEAWYTFGATGRPVHNVIAAQFTFEQQRIVRHLDRFSLHRWATMALGLRGLLLGWTPWLQRRIRAQAAKGLAAYVLRGPGPGRAASRG